MRISYSTPGDAYNRVMVVSPRKRERIFEYIRISNVWSFNTREFFHYRSASVSNLFSKNLLSLSSSIVENPEYKCFLVKKRRTTIQLFTLLEIIGKRLKKKKMGNRAWNEANLRAHNHSRFRQVPSRWWQPLRMTNARHQEEGGGGGKTISSYRRWVLDCAHVTATSRHHKLPSKSSFPSFFLSPFFTSS